MNLPSQEFEEKEVPKEIAPEVTKLEEKIIEKGGEFREAQEGEKSVEEGVKTLKREAVLKAPPAGTAPQVVQEDTSKIAAIPEKENQVETLLKIAQEKGAYHAIQVAKKLDDPYLIDIFHDRIVGDFFDSLVSQGKLKSL